jgi:5-methylcytosine-specific restriction endonuclease McrA
MEKMCIKDYYKEFNKEYNKENKGKGYKNLIYGTKSNKGVISNIYNIENIDELYKNADKKRENKRNRYKTDSLYRLTCNIRSITHKAFKINGIKKNDRTENIIGISFNDFKEYIINQFEPWMNENNQGVYTGNYNETWQLDHIIAISTATSLEDVVRLSHYTNLRPLCSRKNIEKGNK